MAGRQPLLICSGPDAEMAASLAAQTAALVAPREALVLVAWCPPKLPFSPLVAAWDAIFDPPTEVAAAQHAHAVEAAAAARDVLAAAGWKVTCDVVRREAVPWRVALEAADALDASAIVVGRIQHPGGLPGSLGRQTRALCHRTHLPLLVLSPGADPPGPDAPALFAFDGSSGAMCAMTSAARLLRQRPALVATAWEPAWADAPIALVGGAPVTVSGALGGRDALGDDAAATARAGARHLTDAGWRADALWVESIRGSSMTLVDLAAEHAAAVVVTGTRGHSTVVSALIGSVAEDLVRHAAGPVLLVPNP